MTTNPSKRRLWPSLYSEEEPVGDINAWIKILATIWFIYLLFNTKNPLSIYFTPSLTEFQMHGSLGLDIRVIAAGLLFLGLVLGSVWWAFGGLGVRGLFPQWRVRDTFLTLWYGLLTLIFNGIGRLFADFVQAHYVDNSSSALDIGEMASWHNYWIVTVRYILMMAGQVIALILIFLALYQLGKRFLPQNKRFIPELTKFLANILAALAYAGLMTTPINPNFMQNVWLSGMQAIPMLWAYRHTRNVLVPILGLIILNRAFIALLIAFSA